MKLDTVNQRGLRLTRHHDPARPDLHWAIYDHGGPPGSPLYRTKGYLRWRFSNRRHAEEYMRGWPYAEDVNAHYQDRPYVIPPYER